MNRYLEIWLTGLLVCSLLLSQAAVAATATGGRVAVARVNGKMLYQDQLEPILKTQRKTSPHPRAAKPEGEAAARRRAVEQLVDVELLSQQARTLEVPGLEEKISARLASLRHGQTPPANQSSETELRTLLSDEFRVEAYLQKQGVADPEIPEAEIRAMYDKGRESFLNEEAVHLRHITIQWPAEAPDAAKAAARAVLDRARNRLLAGASLENACAEALRDAGGFYGDLGLLTRREMPEAIARAAFALEPGRSSDVIETPYGVHVVSILERRPAGIAPYEDVREFLRKYLQEGRRQQVYRQLVEKLRKQADIEILPGPG